MHIRAFPSGPYLTNGICIVDTESQTAIIIDSPSGSYARVKSFFDEMGVMPSHILLTHSHWDHIADISYWKEVNPKIQVGIHYSDAYNLISPGTDGVPCPMQIPGIQPEFFLEHNQKVEIGPFSFHIIHTPGHSHGSVCLYLEKERILFSGDTLFFGTIGILSLPTSEPEKMWSSLKMLSTLPDETIVWPGHGKKTSIGAEQRILQHAEQLFSN